MEEMLEGHRLANYFPPLDKNEFKDLVRDIRDNGQLSPIVLYEGKILDGKNRYRACQALGITPITKEYDGDDPLSFVISSNVMRRHLDAGQRAMLSLELLPELEGRARENKIEKTQSRPRGKDGRLLSSLINDDKGRKPRSVDLAGKYFHVSGFMVQNAKQIRQAVDDGELGEDVIVDIINGEKTLNEVHRELDNKQYVKKAKERAKEENHKLPDKYPQGVKDHLDFLKDMKAKLKTETEKSVRLKNEQQFSPESIQFITNLHKQIIAMFKEMEEAEDEKD